MRLDIDGIEKLGGWTDDRISVLYCVGQKICTQLSLCITMVERTTFIILSL